MSLLEQLRHFDPTLRFELHVPKQSRLAKTARRIEGLVDTLPSKPQHIPQELIDESLTALQAQRASSLTNRSMRVLCVAGLNSLAKMNNPIECVKQLTTEIISRTKSSLYRALLSGYLQIADLDFEWVRTIRSFLNDHKDQLPRKWINRCAQFGLLDDIPCKKLADQFWNESLEFDTQLDQAGITGALRTTGIGKQLLQRLCIELSRCDWLFEKNANQLLERFFSFVTPNGELSFAGHSSQDFIAHALLEPCVNQQPEPHIQKQIERFLISAYSDPRVNPGKWGHVPTDLIQVLNRWLTKQAMGLLLEVLNRTADEHHWDSRNEFWSFYLENDYVAEAWVIFGPEPHRHAKDLVITNPDFSAGTFGEFKRGGGQVQANHSVLLMRIDNVVIAEWTHNGRVRLWDHGSKTCPPFYRQHYFADILRGSGVKHCAQEEFNHDQYGHWKDKVDKFIYERTGIKHGNITNRRASTSVNQKVRGYPRVKPKVRVSARDQARSARDQVRPDPFANLPSARTSAGDPYSQLPQTSTCKGCGQTKPAKDFFISKKRLGHLTVFCRQCSKENSLMRSKNN